jgi:hypothetical protein
MAVEQQAGAAAPPAAPSTTSAPTVSLPDRVNSEVVQRLVTLLANVSVLTALLVYFGWRRSETMAYQLGIDESILGMSTREYVLRSVGPVLTLLSVVAGGALLWLWFDRRIVGRIRRGDGADRAVRLGLLFLSLAWVLLPLLVLGLGYVWRAAAFVVFPLSIGAGVLMMLYGIQLRQLAHGAERLPPGREALLRGFAAIAVGVCLFWAASNHAEVLGRSLARELAGQVDRLTSVVVYSPKRLHLTAPGAREQRLPGGDTAYRYRYTGLRLLEHTGGHYFLVSDGWTPRYGVVVMLADGDPVRLEFVRDRRS